MTTPRVAHRQRSGSQDAQDLPQIAQLETLNLACLRHSMASILALAEVIQDSRVKEILTTALEVLEVTNKLSKANKVSRAASMGMVVSTRLMAVMARAEVAGLRITERTRRIPMTPRD